MSRQDIIRAWKDDEFRNSLSAEERALLPENPAGEVELTLSELEAVEAGSPTGGPICWSISISVALSIEICYSMYAGGTCDAGSFGCC